MKNHTSLFLYLIIMISICSCNPNPNMDETGKDELKSLEVNREIDEETMAYQDTVYVPIYSNIYVDVQYQNVLLSATLSIRNTSYSDSLFITTIDYFNTEGSLVRSYINRPISLPPMATVNYVIERDDDTGGAGANFIVAMNAKHTSIKPIVQAIMIGQSGNKGFAFSTDGYSILE